jgi:hypothetical protein
MRFSCVLSFNYGMKSSFEFPHLWFFFWILHICDYFTLILDLFWSIVDSFCLQMPQLNHEYSFINVLLIFWYLQLSYDHPKLNLYQSFAPSKELIIYTGSLGSFPFATNYNHTALWKILFVCMYTCVLKRSLPFAWKWRFFVPRLEFR